MHFSVRGYLFVVLGALLGVAGTWSDDAGFAGAWLFPVFLLFAGLAIEAWYQRGTRVSVQMQVESRLKLGRPVAGAYVFEHNRGRALRIQYARVLPAAVRQSEEVREIELPPDGELLDPVTLLPLRLGAGRFADVPARLLGRFSLAWWTRTLPQDAAFAVAPDSLPRGARAIAGESAGETPRRLPGSGVELLQLREYTTGDALSRIDWKATARRGTLVSREYSEAQHLEILVVIDASRASRVRAGQLDRLGLYANVAARLAEHAVSVEDRVDCGHAERTLGACLPDREVRAVTRLRRARDTRSGRGEPNPVAAAIQVRRMLRHRVWSCGSPDLAEPARNEQLCRPQGAGAATHAHRRSPHAAEITRPARAAAVEWRDPAVTIAARAHRQRAQEQVAALRHQGVVVLDEADDALDQAVFHAYLQLRRRRRV
jgi:uncharacterized protein (DUF58 family)